MQSLQLRSTFASSKLAYLAIQQSQTNSLRYELEPYRECPLLDSPAKLK
jgi:hypothetical protein